MRQEGRAEVCDKGKTMSPLLLLPSDRTFLVWSKALN